MILAIITFNGGHVQFISFPGRNRSLRSNFTGDFPDKVSLRNLKERPKSLANFLNTSTSTYVNKQPRC